MLDAVPSEEERCRITAAAIRESFLDRGPDRDHRPDLASAFSAIVVFAQELVPGRVGTVAGVFFGFAFGAGGLGAAMLGQLADSTSIDTVFTVCSFLPAIGLLTWSLPNIEPARHAPLTASRWLPV